MNNFYNYQEINDMSVRQINKLFRANDDSNKWPICGRFNATERAINRIRKRIRQGLEINGGLEYYFTLEREISDIVNNY